MTEAGKPNPAETYEAFFVPAMFEPCAEALFALAAPSPGQRVLDVACGTGVVAVRAAAIVGADHVVGVDFAPPMLAVARGKNPAIDWRQGDAAKLDLPDASFDLVYCQHGLQFVPDRAAAAREMRRVLRDGGRAVVAAWCALDRLPLPHALMSSVARHTGLPLAALSRPFSLGGDELGALFTAAGFAVDVVERTLHLRFPSADQYVRLTSMAAAAVMPELAGPGFIELTAAIERDVADVIAAHRDGDAVVMDQSMSVAVARV